MSLDVPYRERSRTHHRDCDRDRRCSRIRASLGLRVRRSEQHHHDNEQKEAFHLFSPCAEVRNRCGPNYDPMLSSIGKRIRRAHSHRRDKDALVASATGAAMDAALSRRRCGEKIETHTIKAGIKPSLQVRWHRSRAIAPSWNDADNITVGITIVHPTHGHYGASNSIHASAIASRARTCASAAARRDRTAW
jgi:hypothetical protein